MLSSKLTPLGLVHDIHLWCTACPTPLRCSKIQLCYFLPITRGSLWLAREVANLKKSHLHHAILVWNKTWLSPARYQNRSRHLLSNYFPGVRVLDVKRQS